MNNKKPVIVYIGASGGIGKPGCKHLVNRGAHVVMVSRKRESLGEIQLEIDPTGQNTLVAPADASIPGEVIKILHEAVRAEGRIDAVIVAIGGHIASGPDDDPEQALLVKQKLHETMVVPTFNAIFETQKFFRDKKTNSPSPLLVHMSSHAVFKDEKELDNNIAYRLAKEDGDKFLWSLIPLLEAVGARATNIRPGTVNTEKNERFLNSPEKKAAAVQPEAIMDLILEVIPKEKVEADYYLASGAQW